MGREKTLDVVESSLALSPLDEAIAADKRNEQILFKLGTKNTARTISFKNELSWINDKDRASHNIHRYPAKLIHHIPYFFIRNNRMSLVGGTILDVFCGSGTVLVESMLAGRNCIGTDINPLCRLISNVKTTPLDQKELQSAVNELFTKMKEKVKVKPPSFPNINYWFTRGAQLSLAKIKWAIDACDFSNDFRDFFYVCFSSIIRKASNADPRISPPVFSKRMKKRVGEGRRVYPMKYFKQETMKNCGRILKFSSLCPRNYGSQILSDDAMKLSLKDETVDLVITSPPYMSAQKYFRSTKLELFWLELVTEEEIRRLDSKLVGTERIKSDEYSQLLETGISEADKLIKKIYRIDRLRAGIAAKYFIDLRSVFGEVFRCLKYGKYFVLIIGDNEVKGHRIPSHKIVSKLAEEVGFKRELSLVDEIKSRGLMTKRNKTAGLINSEWILVFKKEV